MPRPSAWSKSGSAGALKTVWRQGALVGEILYLAADPGLRRTEPAALVALLRARVARVAGQTGWERLLDEAAAETVVTKRTALRAFALAIGPLPGVPRPAGAAGPIPSGDDAIDWTLAYFSTLSPAQRAAVTAALRPSAKRSRVRRGHAVTEARDEQVVFGPTTGPVPPLDARLSADADRLAAELGRRLGDVVPTFRSVVVYSDLPNGVLGDFAQSEGLDANGRKVGTPTRCLIQVNSAKYLLLGRRPAPETLAHEVFHCLQMQLVGGQATLALVHRRDRWLTDGGADWAACEVTGGGPVTRGNFRNYTRAPLAATPVGLPQMSYEAMGFFSQLQRQGIDPFTRMQSALTGGSTAESYLRLVGSGGEETFLDNWAASFAQDPARGGPWWSMAGTCYRPTAASPPQIPISSTTSETLRAAPLAPVLRSLEPTPGNYRVRISVIRGRLRLSSGRIDDLITTTSGPRTYCLRDLTEGGKSPYVALSGDVTGGAATIEGIPGECTPQITQAMFTVDHASLTVGASDVNVGWNITWNGAAHLMPMPLRLGSEWVALRPDYVGGGSYTTKRFDGSVCSGIFEPLPGGPDPAYSAQIRVVGENSARTSWDLFVTADLGGSGGDLYISQSNCVPPDWGNTGLPGFGKRLEATVKLDASGGVDQTKMFTVSSTNAGESWTGTLTLVGDW